MCKARGADKAATRSTEGEAGAAMRIHSLLIAGALAGLMANATPSRALEVNATAYRTMKPTSHHHKHVTKHGGSEKHLAITKDGKARTAGGTVSKQLMGKSNRSAERTGQSFRRSSKHHANSSNASMKHHKKSGQSKKSTSTKYQ
jgi:hypothetical protein